MNEAVLTDTDRLAADTEIVREYLDRATAPPQLSEEEKSELLTSIRALMEQKNARLVAHYYTDPDLQDLADSSDGFVGDSLEMARFGKESDADILLVAGVRFMGESAKILSPEKKVIMPTLEATCSLDIGCPIDEFSAFCDANSDRTVVVYANTSAAVKARSDWVVTSSIALDLVEHLAGQGEKILWAPDRHLGAYIQDKTGADMLLWDGACIVHEEFKIRGLKDVMALHPDAAVLAHPESPAGVLEVADMVGSTTQIIKASQSMPQSAFIVATDRGIFHKLQQLSPQKKFIIAPTAGEDATCRSCANCPWMAMNSLQNLHDSLRDETNEVLVDRELGIQAMVPLQRMLEFAAANQIAVKGKA